ncbi:MAG: methyltransferase [Planctomycetota bacterium]|nr:methyltransferase [Planctomycetota bacterium]
MRLSLSARDRRLFVESILAKKLGISLNSFVESAIDDLVNSLGTDIDPEAPETIETLIDACCVGETMFMRHAEHFSALKHWVSSRLSRPLSVWSAGCCTGEEAYSLAATLFPLSHDIEVLGTDVNLRFLRKARLARYTAWSLRSIDLTTCDYWLNTDQAGASVKRWLKKYVSFKRVNLLNVNEMTRYDAIFCRNVLMYFYPEVAQGVINSFAEHIKPGGVLFLGYYDPIPDENSLWRRVEYNNIVYYQLRERKKQSSRSPKTIELPKENRAPDKPVKRQPEQIKTSKSVSSQLSPKAVEESLPDPLKDEARLERYLADIYRYASSGKQEIALSIFEIAVDQFPFAAELYIIAALIFAELSQFSEAKVRARKACFLQPDSCYAQYVLGYCLAESGNVKQALNRFKQSQSYLEKIKAAEVVPLSQGLSISQLKRLLDDRLGDADESN